MSDPYEPRKIIPPAGWTSSARVAMALRSIISLDQVEHAAMPARMIDAMDSATAPTQKLHALARFAAANAIRARFKLWHLRRSIGEMLLQTDFPDDTTFGEIPATLPALAIVPHRDLLAYRDEQRGGKVRSVEWIMLLPVGGGESQRASPEPEPEEAAEPTNWLALLCFSNDPGAFSPVPMLYDKGRRMSEVNAQLERHWSGELGSSVIECMQRAAQIAFGALLLMTNYREITYEAPTFHPKARGVPSIMYSMPSWLGDDDGVRTLRQPGEPTGIARATHWRRGHWRKQRVGKGRTGIKMVWLRPILVNADSGAPA